MGNFWPNSSETARPILMKLETDNYRPRSTHHAKRHYDPTMWVVSANTSLPLSRFFLYLFSLFVTPTGHSGGPILTICASKMSFRARMCLLAFLLISSKNFNCGGVNRSFQAKRVKYSNQISQNQRTPVLSADGPLIGVQQVQDGGGPPFWKNS